MTVFERADRIGGLLRYGIPEFKLEKRFLDRRLDADASTKASMFRTERQRRRRRAGRGAAREFDAIVLAGGADRAARSAGARPRAEGHPLRDGIPDAAEPALRRRRDRRTTSSSRAKDKHVIIIGGGDTGADCLGTAHRQGARVGAAARAAAAAAGHARGEQSVAAVAEHLPRLVGARRRRRAALLRSRPSGSPATTTAASTTLHAARGRDRRENGRMAFKPVPGSEFELEADLVLLAMGFVGPERDGMLDELGVKLTERGNVWRDDELDDAACPASSPPATCSAASR